MNDEIVVKLIEWRKRRERAENCGQWGMERIAAQMVANFERLLAEESVKARPAACNAELTAPRLVVVGPSAGRKRREKKMSLRELKQHMLQDMAEFDEAMQGEGLRCPHYRMTTVGPLDGFHVTAKCENCGEEVQIERAAWIAGGIQHAMGKLR